jgi:hypothetical protein
MKVKTAMQASACGQARSDLHEEPKALVPDARITTTGPNTWPTIPLAEVASPETWVRLQPFIARITQTVARPSS